VLEKRKRISKKEIKQDTLVTSYYKAYNFFLENQVRIIIGVGVIALVVVAVILYSNKKSNDSIAAAGLLAKVMPMYDAGQYQQAIDGQKSTNTIGLKEIVDKYGSSESGETAKIFLANSYYNTGKFEEAYKTYDDYSGSNPLFEATALSGKAAYNEGKKDFEKAADLYQDAAKLTVANPSNAEYLMKAGINLMKVGKKEEAKKLFESIKEEYKTSSAAQEVDKYLVQIES
jgi:TolA-binding protein